MTYLDIYNADGAGMNNYFKQSADKISKNPNTVLIIIVVLITLSIIFLVLYLKKSCPESVIFLSNNDAQQVAKNQEMLEADVKNREMREADVKNQAMLAADAKNQAMIAADVKNREMREAGAKNQAMLAAYVKNENKPVEIPNKEDFTNDLPYQLNNLKVNYTQEDDYNDVLQKLSLDADVIENHKQYVNDRNKITSTASFVPARSDTQDIVTTWGLTKSKYIKLDPSAREIPSQEPEQGSKPIQLRWD